MLEDLYGRADFLNVSVHAVSVWRRLPSAADAVVNMRKGAGDNTELMNRLSVADREVAWAEIEQRFKPFEGPNGLEIPGEVLVGVGNEMMSCSCTGDPLSTHSVKFTILS